MKTPTPEAMEASEPSYVLAADVGGTFTDIVLAGSDGRHFRSKVLSTPPDYGDAIMTALSGLIRDHEIQPARIVRTVHGTTVATNAILESKGAATALVTTKGFRDVLELARQRRPSLFDLRWEKPVPLVPRYLRLEVAERTNAKGEIQTAVDIDEVKSIASRLRDNDVAAIAVCFINSYLNSTNEKLVCQLLSEELPDVHVSGSYEILSETGEYERTSTTVVNAYIRPVVDHYIAGLEDQLRAVGVRGELQIMQSSGALLDSRRARIMPVRMVESGPAGGVTAACFLAKNLGIKNAIAFDMGGTTAKATLIESGQPMEAAEYDVGAQMNTNRLLRKGGGYTLKVPSVDISEVGAGGGSIVWIDAGGMPQVGPQSAGASPGPICYGAGGTEPTVTDANLVLGYLDDRALAGGNQLINKDLAVEGFERRIARPLKLGILDAAYGVHTIANTNMSRAIAAVSIERGKDPRDFSLIAFGGAGPMHAPLLAKEFGIATVIVPMSAGLFSAVGLQTADIRYDYAVSFPTPEHRDPASVTRLFEEMRQRAAAELGSSGYRQGDIRFEKFVDQRYAGQSFDLRVPISHDPINAQALGVVERLFHEQHFQTYGNKLAGNPVQITALRLRAVVDTDKRPETVDGLVGQQAPFRQRSRDAYFGSVAGTFATPVLTRGDVPSEPMHGPVIIQDMDATTVVPPGASVRRDGMGNLIISIEI